MPKSKSKVLKKYGKPLLYLNCNSRLNVELFKYRIRIGRYHTKLILHYHRDVLEMYSLIFTSLSDADRLEIHNMIQSKYLDGKLFNYKKHKLADKSGGLMLVESSFGMTIHYISNISSSFIESIEAAERQLVIAEKMKITNNFAKLFDSL